MQLGIRAPSDDSVVPYQGELTNFILGFYTYMELTLNAGKALVDQITALDRSTAPFHEQIVEAFSLVKLDYLEEDRLFSYEPFSDSLLSDYNPIDEWTLRWLLKRLSAGTADAESARATYGTWLLLTQLAVKLPVKVIARLLQPSSLVSATLQALEWLKARTAHAQWTDSGNGNAQRASDTKVPNLQAEKKDPMAGKKRKRDFNIFPEQHGNDLFLAPAKAGQLLFSISLTLKTLHRKIDQNATGSGAFAAQHIKVAIQFPNEAAAKALGASAYCLVHLGHSFQPISILFTLVLESLFEAWQNRRSVMEEGVALSEAVSEILYA